MASLEGKKDPTLTLKTICSELGKVTDKCTTIGVQLGIPRHVLKKFEKEADPLSAVVDYWLKGNETDPIVPISWESIVTALKSDTVGESGLAEKIKDSYCHHGKGFDHSTTENSDELPSVERDPRMDPKVKMDLEFLLNKNLKEIIKKYASYVDCLRAKVEEKGVTPKALRTYLLSLSASSSEAELALISDKKKELENAETISDIFSFLTTECASFLNYEVFQDIIENYDIDVDHQKLKYPNHLMTYAEKHKISEVAKIIPGLPVPNDVSELAVKFNVDNTCKLAKVFDLKNSVAKVLDMFPSALKIFDVRDGCVIVKFYIPLSVADALFTPNTVFTPHQRDKLQDALVLWLECNGHKFEFNNREDVEEVKTKVLEPQEQHTAAASKMLSCDDVTSASDDKTEALYLPVTDDYYSDDKERSPDTFEIRSKGGATRSAGPWLRQDSEWLLSRHSEDFLVKEKRKQKERLLEEEIDELQDKVKDLKETLMDERLQHDVEIFRVAHQLEALQIVRDSEAGLRQELEKTKHKLELAYEMIDEYEQELMFNNMLSSATNENPINQELEVELQKVKMELEVEKEKNYQHEQNKFIGIDSRVNKMLEDMKGDMEVKEQEIQELNQALVNQETAWKTVHEELQIAHSKIQDFQQEQTFSHLHIDELEKTRKALSVKKEEVKDMKDALHRTQMQWENASRKLQFMQEELERSQKDLELSNCKLEAAQEELKTTKSRLEITTEVCNLLQGEVEATEDLNSSIEEVKEGTSQKKKLKRKLSAAKDEIHKMRIDKATLEVTLREKEAEMAKRDEMEQRKYEEYMKKSKRSWQRIIKHNKELQHRNDKLQKENAAIMEQIRMHEELSKQSEIEALRAKVMSLEKENTDLQEQLRMPNTK